MSELYPFRGLPPAQGLYRPEHEHDACGIGFVASIEGRKSHDIVLKGIQILINLTHRGACGCDPQTGDGAGILIQIPHAFFERESSNLGFTLPSPGEYGVGMVFLPVDLQDRLICEGIIEKVAREEGLTVLGWREVLSLEEVAGVAQRVSTVNSGLGGLDAVVFTAGIGEHAPEIRRRVFANYQVNDELMSVAKPGALFIVSSSARKAASRSR